MANKQHYYYYLKNVHLKNAECYELSLLIHDVQGTGPTGFGDLKKVPGMVHLTFNILPAEVRGGLLEDDVITGTKL